MSINWARGRKLAQSLAARRFPGRLPAICAAALMLGWPAIYSGFPLLFPDSMTYLDDGRTVARAVFLHQFSDYYGMRSFFYSLGILPFHWNVTAWPVVGVQNLIIAWVVWLVVRSFAAQRTAGYYLMLMMFLSLLTGMGWYASFIMPDILGPVLYLSIYLLVCAPETLSRGERIALLPIGVWAITGHSTHLPLAVALCVLLALISVCQGRVFFRRARGLGEVAAMIALAAAAQIALHGYLYGKPTLNGERPPYLMVRIIADGPGRWYLEKHCASERWVACKRAARLSDDANSLLWDADGFYDGATDEETDRLAEEETPFVFAAVRSYPREQFLRSAANFGEQLTTFGLFGFHPNDWTLDQFNDVMPAARASYLRSRQARNALPLRLLSTVQLCAILASLAAMAVLIPLLWRRHSPRLGGLSLVIVSVILLNALLTGVLSGPDDRYQGRVIWLVPLLAGIYLMDWLVQRKASAETTQAGSSAGTERGVRASAAAMNTMGKNSSV